MSLQHELNALRESNLAKFDDETKAVILDDLGKLEESGLIENAPKEGQKLQDFTLPNHLGQPVSLADLRKKGPVVVTFYRGGWCPYCNLELRAYQNELLPRINELGATLVAISPELPDQSLTTKERHGIQFEILTDRESRYAREIELAFTIDEKVRSIYADFGIDVETHNGKENFDIPLAATLVVEPDGTIACAVVEPDYTIRAEPADIVKVLESLAGAAA